MKSKLLIKFTIGCLAIFIGLAATPQPLHAVCVEITKIVDTSDDVPDEPGYKFVRFGYPAVNNGEIYFSGDGTFGKSGVYKYSSGTLTVEVKKGDTIPGGDYGPFTAFGDYIALDNGNMLFSGFGYNYHCGIYTDAEGPITAVVDTQDEIPPGGSGYPGNFTSFGDYTLKGATTVFRGISQYGKIGIYSITGSDSIQVLASTNTEMPDLPGRYFESFTGPCQDNNGDVVFKSSGRGSNGQGVPGEQEGIYIYRADSGAIEMLVNRDTEIPGQTGAFTYTDFSIDPVISGGKMAFKGAGGDFVWLDEHHFTANRGVYNLIDGRLAKVADRFTSIPEGTGVFTGFGTPQTGDWNDMIAMDNKGNLVFRASGYDGQQGIYTNMGGQLSKVFDLTQTLDGRQVIEIRFSNGGFEGNTIVFAVRFDGDDPGDYTAIYMAQIINPTGDLNYDGVVNGVDFGIFRSEYGQTGESIADLNNDGVVNGVDFGIFRANYGGTCP